MTNIELLNRILELCPEAMLSIHENSPESRKNSDDGINPIYELKGFLVVWNIHNNLSCPKEEEI